MEGRSKWFHFQQHFSVNYLPSQEQKRRWLRGTRADFAVSLYTLIRLTHARESPKNLLLSTWFKLWFKLKQWIQTFLLCIFFDVFFLVKSFNSLSKGFQNRLEYFVFVSSFVSWIPIRHWKEKTSFDWTDLLWDFRLTLITFLWKSKEGCEGEKICLLGNCWEIAILLMRLKDEPGTNERDFHSLYFFLFIQGCLRKGFFQTVMKLSRRKCMRIDSFYLRRTHKKFIIGLIRLELHHWSAAHSF